MGSARQRQHSTLTHKHTQATVPQQRGHVAGMNDMDTEAGMLSGISRKRSVRSSPYWFTESCNSQCLSHFAAPFIVVRAETSVAESCKKIKSGRPLRTNWKIRSIKQTMAARTSPEDGLSLACCPRVSAWGHRCYLHPHPDPHQLLFTMNQMDACE